MKTTKIHFIDEESDLLIFAAMAFSVPLVDEEIRTGGEGRERYYKVTRRVWVYDEFTGIEIDRVNVGVRACIEDETGPKRVRDEI